MPKEVKWAISFGAGALLLLLGWKMYLFLVALHVGVCLVLIGVILLQSGEAADIAGAFGGSGSQTAFGPRGAATLLSRSTTWCAVMFMFTSMALAVHAQTATGGTGFGHSVLEQFSKPAPKSPIPVTPVAPLVPAAPTTSAPAPSAPAPASGPVAPATTAPVAPAPAVPAPAK